MRTEADGFESGNQERRKLIEVAAIETCSLPRSLAAAHRGFAFYLADPSARLTTIAKAVRMNCPYLAARSVVSVSSRVHPLISVHSCQFVVKIFKKGLDAISFFAAKGCSPICVYAHTRREKTN